MAVPTESSSPRVQNSLTSNIVVRHHDDLASFLTIVRPAKAGMFSGSQSHRGKSRNPVAWVASAEETKRMKPTDKAVLGTVSELPGRNESEPTGGLDKNYSEGRALYGRAKAA
jgi:hypothetical protein